MFEIYNRSVLGEGARSLMVSDYNEVPCLTVGKRELEACFEDVLSEKPRVFAQEAPPSWRALDDVVFDVLGLTAGEREAVYEAVIELVRARLEKARSV